MKVTDMLGGAVGAVGKIAGIQRPTMHMNDMVGLDGVLARRVKGDAGETAVWRVYGKDSADSVAMNGWGRFLLSLDFPITFLIRQHAPGLSKIISQLKTDRPPEFSEGTGALVADSLLDYFGGMERSGNVVDREIYLLAPDRHASEVPSLLDGGGMASVSVEGDQLRRLCYGAVTGRSVSSLLSVKIEEEAGFSCKPLGKRLEFGNRWASCFEITGWPRRMSVLFLERLLGTGFEMDLSYYIFPLSHREALSKLTTAKLAFESTRLDLENRNRMVPPDVTGGIDDVDRLLDEISRNEGGLFWIALSLVVYGDTQEELAAREQALRVYFASMQAAMRPFVFRQGDAFGEFAPQHQAPMGQTYLTDFGTVQKLFPLSPPLLDKGEGTLFAIDSRSKAPVIFDRFAASRDNGHMVVMAPSGSGKSFCIKGLCLRESTRGVPVYLIDPEGEYTYMAEELGGQVFHPGREGSGVNPFRLRYRADDALALQVGNLSCLLQMMLERGGSASTLTTVLDEGLNAFYRAELLEYETGRRVVESDVQGISLGEGGIYSFVDFLWANKDRIRDAERLADALSPYVSGSYRYVFADDRGENATLGGVDEPWLTVFSLQGMTDDMKPIATMICCQTVWALAMSRSRPRMMVVDECWSVLVTKSGAMALQTMVKRGRKYRLGLVTVTQDVGDFLSVGESGIALLSNSSDKLLLRQSAAGAPLIQNALSLTEQQTNYLLRCNIGEGMLISKEGAFQVKIVATAEEFDLIENFAWRTNLDATDAEREIAEVQRLRALSAATAEVTEARNTSSAEGGEKVGARAAAGPAPVRRGGKRRGKRGGQGR